MSSSARDEALVAEDTDGQPDVYENSNGTTSIVSDGPAPDGEFIARFAGASADGSRVFFTTLESLDRGRHGLQSADIYERTGGLTTLIDVGTALAGYPGNGVNPVVAAIRGRRAAGAQHQLTATPLRHRHPS